MILRGRLFDMFAFGDVMRDFHEATQVPRLIHKRHDHTVTPKTRAVFTNLPAFAFRPPLSFGNLQFQLWRAIQIVLRGKKYGDWLSDDLFTGVSIYRFCARFPA